MYRRLGMVVLIVAQGTRALCQLPDYPDDKVADIPVNYTEANVGQYTLPDPLISEAGTRVSDADTWHKFRRPEIVKIFEENQYGRSPERVESVSFEVVEEATPAFDGKALRKQVAIHFGEGDARQTLDLLLYLPASAERPVPVLLNISFLPNNLAVEDPGVKTGRRWDKDRKMRVEATGDRGPFGALPVLETLERGFGIATFNYADVEPDAPDAIEHSVRQLYMAEGQEKPAADEWGSIAAWAWGMSRVVDYFETDNKVDASRIAITGISRLGKTVMWAGAYDPRIALVIASCSGEGGAALSHRDYGETIAHLVAPSRYYYWFADNYRKWADNPKQAPMDAHLLMALVAPRPLLLQTGNTDKWADPMGEFLAAVAATPVYELLGKRGIDSAELPPAGQLAGDTLAFYMHDGGHGLVPGDWGVYLDFIEKHFNGAE